jgi:xanthine/uracil permease
MILDGMQTTSRLSTVRQSDRKATYIISASMTLALGPNLILHIFKQHRGDDVESSGLLLATVWKLEI